MSVRVDGVARDAVQRTSLSGQVVARLGQYLEDSVAPGDSLPPVRELAERFDVSVPVVREAIAELAGQGRLQRSQGRPTIARAPSARELQVIFASTLRRRSGRTQQLLDFRRTVRVGAVRGAAQHATSSDIARFRTQLAGWAGPAVGPEQLRRADLEFHRQIAEATHNDLVLLNLAAVDAMLREVDLAAWQRRLQLPYTDAQLVEDYSGLVNAMAARRHRRAEKLLHDHLDRWERDFCYS